MHIVIVSIALDPLLAIRLESLKTKNNANNTYAKFERWNLARFSHWPSASLPQALEIRLRIALPEAWNLQA